MSPEATEDGGDGGVLGKGLKTTVACAFISSPAEIFGTHCVAYKKNCK